MHLISSNNDTKHKGKLVKSVTFFSAIVIATFSLLVSAAEQHIASNANDAYITKPGADRKIDLGAIIEVDAQGYPTTESIDMLYDEMDFQRAVSAYLQAMPQMALFSSVKTNHYYGATGATDSLVMRLKGTEGLFFNQL